MHRFGWRIHAFVLMTNHYHLLLETPEPTLSRGMRELNGIYTQRFNRTHDRVGHLFQGRFKGILVEKESHLLELTRYVTLNPVRAGIVTRPEDWPWSSYRGTAGLQTPPDWLEVEWTLNQFAPDHDEARRQYREFVAAGVRRPGHPWRQLRGQIYLGGELFVRRMQKQIDGHRLTDDVPKRQLRISRPGLRWIVAAVTAQVNRRDLNGLHTRAMIALLARDDAGERLAAIGQALSIQSSMASKLARRGAALMKESTEFSNRVNEIRRLWAASSHQDRFKV